MIRHDGTVDAYLNQKTGSSSVLPPERGGLEWQDDATCTSHQSTKQDDGSALHALPMSEDHIQSFEA